LITFATAGDRAAGACCHHDRVELAAALIDDLAAGAELVCVGVRTGSSIDLKCANSDHLAQPARDTDVTLGRVPRGFGRRANDLGAERFEHDLFFPVTSSRAS